jgi:hypothetical protein
MFVDALIASGGLPLLAESTKALVTWTPTTFYIAAAIIQVPVIWLGYQFLGGDPEYTNFPAALAVAAVGNVIAFFLKDLGVVGAVSTSAALYGLLLVTSGIDIFRSMAVFGLVMMSYWGFGQFVVERTPLDAYSIGGPAKVMLTGGLQPEPLESDNDQ